ncbi:unnamed protein product [Gongylonema pulchrum]|uniref:CUT domain-containing protein n=1 Tax=Gongylonema pulchrum TaxID=637853 RepID=A0A183EEU8_9BILA|nr:unnamed protein product [Gongylonema pulchrum]
MEGLESSPMTNASSDPLLSSTIRSKSPKPSPAPDVYRGHIQSDSDFPGHANRTSPRCQSASSTNASSVGFNQYTTLTPLQPLPPISTVTSSVEKFAPSSSPVASDASTCSTSANLFFQQAPTNPVPGSLNFGSFAYNVNIKYVYDMKDEPHVPDPQSVSVSNSGETTDYTTSVSTHQQLHQLIAGSPFPPSQPSFVPSYLEPKQEKIEFINSSSYGTFNGSADVLEAVPIGAVERSDASPMQTETVRQPESPDSGSDLEELNTKELAQRISAELKRYSIPQAIFAQRVLCRFLPTL